MRVPPLGRDSELVLDWLDHDNAHGLGAAYDDFVAAAGGGQSYTTTCGNDLSSVVPGRLFGDDETDIRAHWQV